MFSETKQLNLILAKFDDIRSATTASPLVRDTFASSCMSSIAEDISVLSVEVLGASAPELPWADTPDVNASKVETGSILVSSSVFNGLSPFHLSLVALVALVAMLWQPCVQTMPEHE